MFSSQIMITIRGGANAYSQKSNDEWIKDWVYKKSEDAQKA